MTTIDKTTFALPGLTPELTQILRDIIIADWEYIPGEDDEDIASLDEQFYSEKGYEGLFYEVMEHDVEVDSCYIHHRAIYQNDDHKFTLWASQYRKDMSVCDTEFEDEISYEDLTQVRKEKEQKAAAKVEASDKQWYDLIENQLLDADAGTIYEVLKQYKFPTKWKKK